jgi:hypothetical protein
MGNQTVHQTSQLKEQQTLMQAYQRLEHKCEQLRDLSGLTELLTTKLNRTLLENQLLPESIQKEEVVQKNIVELFNLIADKIEAEINIIGNNTEYSISMID